MNTAVLAVYFGSSDLESMELLERPLYRAVPGCSLFRAFLHVPAAHEQSLPQVLAQLQHFDRVLIQPMLVSEGSSCAKIRQLAGPHPVGQPLLAAPSAVAAAIGNWLPRPLLLMGHGAPSTDLTAFADQLQEGVFYASLHGLPDLDSQLSHLAGQTVHLAPFLLTAGYHLKNDLIAWQTRLETAGCRVICHSTTLAHCSGIPECFASHLRTLSQGGSPCP